jgi:hypothetical protein
MHIHDENAAGSTGRDTYGAGQALYGVDILKTS